MVDEIDIIISKNIKFIRLMRDKRVIEVADAIGVSVQQWYNYENAKTKIFASTLYKLSKLFKVDLQVFYIERNFRDV